MDTLQGNPGKFSTLGSPPLELQVVAKANARDIRGIVAADPRYLIVEKPVWDHRAGDLGWRGQFVLHLSDHAGICALILDDFARLEWVWVIHDSLERELLRDATLPRRHAVHRLNRAQGQRCLLHFFSQHGGLIGWCPTHWTNDY